MEQNEIASEVRESGLLSIDQLVELFSFMAVKEGSELSFCKSTPREKRSITYMSGDGITLPCTNEFEGGVMNYIATKGGLESFTNPSKSASASQPARADSRPQCSEERWT